MQDLKPILFISGAELSQDKRHMAGCTTASGIIKKADYLKGPIRLFCLKSFTMDESKPP